MLNIHGQQQEGVKLQNKRPPVWKYWAEAHVDGKKVAEADAFLQALIRVAGQHASDTELREAAIAGHGEFQQRFHPQLPQ